MRLCKDCGVTPDDKIRDLCSKVLTTQDDEAVKQLLPQLRQAIHEHCEILRSIAEKTWPKI
jgi:hypothetical protein